MAGIENLSYEKRLEDIDVNQELGDLMEEVLEENQDVKNKSLDELTDEDIQELLSSEHFDTLQQQKQELLEDMRIKEELDTILYKYDVNVGEMSIARAMQVYEGITVLKKNNPDFLKMLFLSDGYEIDGELVEIDDELSFREVEFLMRELAETQAQRELLEYQSIIEDRKVLKSIEKNIIKGQISKALDELQSEIDANQSASSLTNYVDEYFGKDMAERFDQLFVDVRDLGTFKNSDWELMAFRTVWEQWIGTEIEIYNDEQDISYKFGEQGFRKYSMIDDSIDERVAWKDIDKDKFEEHLNYFEQMIEDAKEYKDIDSDIELAA